MEINETNINGLFQGFKTTFNKGLEGAKRSYKTVSMEIPSTTAEESYGWLGAIPSIREWIGDRIVNSLSITSYQIKNRKFELTVGVPRDKIEDDQYGIYGPIMEKMGRDVALHPDELIFSLLGKGFQTTCFDGQYFFDKDHPVVVNGKPVSVSNVQDGTDDAWYLLDCSQPLKPLIYQNRASFHFTTLDNERDQNVFFKDEYIYGGRGRSNAGLGLWQLAFASKAPLNKENYEAARKAMMSLKSDSGKPLGITPTHLVIPTMLEGNGRRILNALLPDGGTNEWAGSAELIVTPFL